MLFTGRPGPDSRTWRPRPRESRSRSGGRAARSRRRWGRGQPRPTAPSLPVRTPREVAVERHRVAEEGAVEGVGIAGISLDRLLEGEPGAAVGVDVDGGDGWKVRLRTDDQSIDPGGVVDGEGPCELRGAARGGAEALDGSPRAGGRPEDVCWCAGRRREHALGADHGEVAVEGDARAAEAFT